jgi:hypothetical protein
MTILTSFRNPRDGQALVTSIYWRLPFLLKLEAFSCSDFAASHWAARASNILCRRVVTSALNWELWSRAYLLFVKIAGEILSSHAS